MSLLTNTGFPTYSYAPTTVAGHGTGVRNAQIYGRGYIPALRAEGQMLEERVKLHREMMTAQACEPQAIESHISAELKLRAAQAEAEEATMRAEKVEAIACRAVEEHRRRAAEAKAAAEESEKAASSLRLAEAAAAQATAARDNEQVTHHQKTSEARAAGLACNDAHTLMSQTQRERTGLEDSVNRLPPVGLRPGLAEHPHAGSTIGAPPSFTGSASRMSSPPVEISAPMAVAGVSMTQEAVAAYSANVEEQCGGRVLHVPRDYGTVGEAVAAATPGDRVLVAPGGKK